MTCSRIAAIVLAAIILAWQGWNAATGKFLHRFLIGDLVAAAILMATAFDKAGGRRLQVGLLIGFATMGGVLLAAVGATLVDGFQVGRLAAAVGLAVCVFGAAAVGRAVLRD